MLTIWNRPEPGRVQRFQALALPALSGVDAAIVVQDMAWFAILGNSRQECVVQSAEGVRPFKGGQASR